MIDSIPQILLSTPKWALAGILAVTFAGCGRDDVKVHQLPKESSAPQPMPKMQSGDLLQIAPGPAPAHLTWTLPQGWEEQTPGEMRVASFSVRGSEGTADVSVVPLSGAAGGDLANVNRWRGQVGLPPIAADGLKGEAGSVEVGNSRADLFEQAGTNAAGDAARILAVIEHHGDTTWFFKMTGDSALVAREKPAFVAFLKSVKFDAADTAGLPPSHPPMDGMTLAAATPMSATAEAHPNWQVPADWKETSGGAFLVDKFLIGGDGSAQASVNVSTSSGDGGGLAANVNRWRQQLGLPTLSDAELASALTSVDVQGGKATFVDMSGKDARTGESARLIGAVVPQSGQTWFYKLMGDSKIVEQQKDAFTSFVRTVQYANAR